MKKLLKKRTGTSLIEVMGVLLALTIIGSIAFGASIAGTRKARESNVLTAMNAYENVFSDTCSRHPGLINDREKAWNEGAYTSEEGLARLVGYINADVDKELSLYWDDEYSCYVSTGSDPWGGKYILTEFPEDPASTENLYNPASGKAMRIAIWCTGISDTILEDGIVLDNSVGRAFEYVNGMVNVYTQNVDGIDRELTGRVVILN